jgi:hypothetical protein
MKLEAIACMVLWVDRRSGVSGTELRQRRFSVSSSDLSISPFCIHYFYVTAEDLMKSV